jgi:hypothetical protein
MVSRITTTRLAEIVATQGDAITEILGLLQAQHSTPTVVAATVEATTDKPAAEPAKPTASDELFAFVGDKGLAFARGGRSYLTQDHLKAAVRVLKTGTPEVLPYSEGSKLTKRGVSHIAMARSEDGTVLTQFVYTPES